MKIKRLFTKTQGFTLVELMIAITILSFISLGIYQNTSQSFALRENLEKDIDLYNSARVALDIFGKDIIHIFTPHRLALPGNLGVPLKDLKDENGNPIQIDGPLGSLLDFWGEPINKEGVRPSRFNGSENKISFLTNSHIRLFKDSNESEFAKITYKLDADPYSDKPGEKKDIQALFKIENTDIFSDREKPDLDNKLLLLTSVRKMKFRYLEGEKDTWHNTWDTSSMTHKDVFPSVIEITLEVVSPINAENTVSIIQRFRPEQIQ